MKLTLQTLPGIFTVALLVWLVGCSGSPSGPYTVRHDSAPVRPINPEDVKDAIPVADPITRAGNTSPYRVRGLEYRVLADSRFYRERGIASWYGAKFHGHKTANGEIYNLYLPTAAHRTLPIPSYVRVTNVENGRSIVVRVNDRGPFHPNRIIDLSYAAAVKLGYMELGTARVEVEVVTVPGVDDRRDSSGSDHRFLQVGAFGVETSAKQLRGVLATALSSPVFVSPVRSGNSLLYRVRVGPMAYTEALAQVRRQLMSLGYSPGQPVP